MSGLKISTNSEVGAIVDVKLKIASCLTKGIPNTETHWKSDLDSKGIHETGPVVDSKQYRQSNKNMKTHSNKSDLMRETHCKQSRSFQKKKKTCQLKSLAPSITIRMHSLQWLHTSAGTPTSQNSERGHVGTRKRQSRGRRTQEARKLQSG